MSTMLTDLVWCRSEKEKASGEPALDDIRREFPGWVCWQRGGLCYARRPHTPEHGYDAHSDDPADLREAILLALSDSSR